MCDYMQLLKAVLLWPITETKTVPLSTIAMRVADARATVVDMTHLRRHICEAREWCPLKQEVERLNRHVHQYLEGVTKSRVIVTPKEVLVFPCRENNR